MRKRCPHLDPADQVSNLSLGQSFLRWHFQFVAGSPNRFNDQAFFRLTGDDRGASFTTLQDGIASIQSQSPPLLIRPMTGLAFLNK